jgi:hypothetical protein
MWVITGAIRPSITDSKCMLEEPHCLAHLIHGAEGRAYVP